MTDTDQADAGPAYELPDRPPLDALSAAVLAVNGELDRQMLAQPDAMIALDPRRIAEAALGGVGGLPRVPEWTGDPRTMGGRHMDGTTGQEAEVTVDTCDDGVRLTVQAEDPHTGAATTHYIHVNPTDAEGWFLAGLAAVAAARQQT